MRGTYSHILSSEIAILLLMFCSLKTASVKQLPSWNVSCPQECSCSIRMSQYLNVERKTVDCSWSSLDDIPLGIPLTAQVLILSNNNITSLLNLPEFPSLLELDLSSNNLQDISSRPMFGRLGSLVSLNISSNNIQEIHHGAFSGLKHMEILDLSFNSLHSIEHQDAFAGLNHLHKLFLTGNQLTSLGKDWLNGMVHLQELHLNQNQISDISEGSVNVLKDLKQLVLSDNFLKALPENVFKGLGNLYLLDISKNNLTKIPTRTFQQLSNRTELVLNGNPIRRVHTNDFLNMDVENVSLSYMPILSLIEKSAFHNMTNLRILHIRQNKQLFFIDPFAFSNVPHLQWLLVDGNHLSALPQQVEESLPQLTEVHVYDNPLSCDCNIHWIRQLLETPENNSQSHITFPHSERILCDNLTVPVPLMEVPVESIPAVCSPATIPLFNDTNQLEVGETLRLECHALGIPTPNMQWMLSNGKRLNITSENVRASLIDDSVLIVHNIKAEDSGTYACEASNEVGYDISSTAVRVHSSNIRVVILHQSKTFITLTWNGTDSTVQSSDYKILYNQAGSSSGQKEIHLHPFLRKYTITNLTPDTSYELCVVYVHNSVYHKVHCLNISTLHEAYVLQGITRISKQKIIMGVIIVFSLGVLACVAGLIVKKWRRKGYEKTDNGEIAETMSQIPLENLYQPPSTPLCTSRTSLLPSSQA
ncbi:leucine-rich repeat neuronal protein 1-like [Liolophura sinensis]|uniref:leucine-rich repeat neuronal protein 1-like n=1 Tax=Liolophura sinensis TaxID=3198878 RepID=UPI0031586B3E